MARPRFKNLPPEKQHQILDSAAQEFSANGFEKASFNRIIAACNISKGAMYYYFDDKWDLFSTVVLELFGASWSQVEPFPEVSTKEEFWRMMVAFMAKMSSRQGANPHMQGIVQMWGEIRNHPQANTLMEQAWKPIMAMLTDAMTRGQQLNAVRQDLPLRFMARLAWGMGEHFDNYVCDRMNTGAEFDFARLGEFYVDLLRRLVEVKKDGEDFSDLMQALSPDDSSEK